MGIRTVRGLLLFAGVGGWLLAATPRVPVLVWVYAALAAAIFVADGLSPTTGWIYWLTAGADGVAVGLLVSAVVGPAASSVAVTAAGVVAREGGTALGAIAMVWLTARHGGGRSRATRAGTTAARAARSGSLRAAVASGAVAWAVAASLGVAGFLAALLPVAALAGNQRSRESDRRYGRVTTELERIRASVESRDLLLGTLAHEIRTPLTIIQATEGVLLDESPGPLNERQRKFLESIHANTQRLVHFSENMLASIKVDRGWIPDRTSSIDLRRLTRQVIEMMQVLLDQRRQHVRYTFPSMMSKPMADEAWIRQVLVNLLHNASKHAGESGMIVISVTENDQWVVVTVSDNGEGLSGPGRESLFEEFYQEQPHTGAGQDGTGLGLAIVRSVIERHGGKVYVAGSAGLGTMVSFALPVEAPE